MVSGDFTFASGGAAMSSWNGLAFTAVGELAGPVGRSVVDDEPRVGIGNVSKYEGNGKTTVFAKHR